MTHIFLIFLTFFRRYSPEDIRRYKSRRITGNVGKTTCNSKQNRTKNELEQNASDVQNVPSNYFQKHSNRKRRQLYIHETSNKIRQRKTSIKIFGRRLAWVAFGTMGKKKFDDYILSTLTYKCPTWTITGE